MMVTMARAGCDHLALARGADVHLAADRRKDLRVTQLDLGLFGESAGVFDFAARRVHGASGNDGQQLVGAGLAQRGFGGGNVFAGRFDGGFGRLQAGGRFVLGLLAHDALLRQRDGAAGVGLLMVVAWPGPGRAKPARL